MKELNESGGIHRAYKYTERSRAHREVSRHQVHKGKLSQRRIEDIRSSLNKDQVIVTINGTPSISLKGIDGYLSESRLNELKINFSRVHY